MDKDGIKDLVVLDDPASIKLLFSPKHNRLLKLLQENEQSVFELSKALDMNPGTVHYYIKDLEKRGLVRQVREDTSGGVLKKYYRAAARRFYISGPDFAEVDQYIADPSNRYYERAADALEHYGYYWSGSAKEALVSAMEKYDRRLHELFLSTENEGLDRSEDQILARGMQRLMFSVRVLEDEELRAAYEEMRKLLSSK